MTQNENYKVVLPLQKPILSTWSSESHLFSMILNEPNSIDWIMNNYIQVTGLQSDKSYSPSFSFTPNHDPTNPHFPINAWNMCPFIEYKMVSSDFISNSNKSILEYIINAINLEYYVYLDLDQSYRTERDNEKRWIHKNFIFGYNLKENVFFVADHFNVGKYSTSTITFSQLVEAYRLAYDPDIQISSAARFFVSMKEIESRLYEPRKILVVKVNKYDYGFNVDLMKISLKDYLESSYSFDSIIPFQRVKGVTYSFGLDNYDLLQCYLEKLLIDKDYQSEWWPYYLSDWRPFTFFKDHKRLLKFRITYLEEKKFLGNSEYLINTIRFIENESVQILNLFLKFTITKNRDTILAIINKLNLMKEHETKFLLSLLDCL